jgi:hypothetical protein
VNKCPDSAFAEQLPSHQHGDSHPSRGLSFGWNTKKACLKRAYAHEHFGSAQGRGCGKGHEKLLIHELAPQCLLWLSSTQMYNRITKEQSNSGNPDILECWLILMPVPPLGLYFR